MRACRVLSIVTRTHTQTHVCVCVGGAREVFVRTCYRFSVDAPVVLAKRYGTPKEGITARKKETRGVYFMRLFIARE